MTFDQIEILEKIVEKGSFKAAAEALHRTQPTLSVAIKKLEDEFELLLEAAGLSVVARRHLPPRDYATLRRMRAPLERTTRMRMLPDRRSTMVFAVRAC